MCSICQQLQRALGKKKTNNNYKASAFDFKGVLKGPKFWSLNFCPLGKSHGDILFWSCEWFCWKKVASSPYFTKKKQTKVCPSWDPAGPSTHWLSLFTSHGSVLALSHLWKMALFKSGTMGLCVSCLHRLQYNMHVVWSHKGKWPLHQQSRIRTHGGLQDLTWVLSLLVYSCLLQCFSMQVGCNTPFVTAILVLIDAECFYCWELWGFEMKNKTVVLSPAQTQLKRAHMEV